MFHGEHEESSAFFFLEKNNNPRVTGRVIRIHIYVTLSSLILPYGKRKSLNLVSLLLLLFIESIFSMLCLNDLSKYFSS